MFAQPVVPPVFLFGEDCGRRMFMQTSGDGKSEGPAMMMMTSWRIAVVVSVLEIGDVGGVMIDTSRRI